MASKSKEPLDITGAGLLPEGLTIDMLKEFWSTAEIEYANSRRRMYLLDGADRSQLWKTITANFPSYQVLPETNHINYLKENLVSSIYVVGKSATVVPRTQEEMEIAQKINMALAKLWYQLEVTKYQRKAGDRAALFNIGITQVGWRNSIIGGTTGMLTKGDVVLKNIDPQKFMRDPYADSDDNATYMLTWDDFHISNIKRTPIYKERINELIKVVGENLTSSANKLSYEDTSDRAKDNKEQKKYHRVVTFFIRLDSGAIWEVHMLNNEYILYAQESPFKLYPFAILYCNEPGNDLIGVSEPAKAFSNYLAYNMLNSIVATHAYKAQRPPRFLNMQSGINARQFAKYGADADKTWLVNGDASMAVHYGQFPALPASMDVLPAKLDYDIKDKSGIDDMYAGKDFGSVTTTGGTDNVLSRTTGRDVVKIQLYEEYTKRVTQLILLNYIKYGKERKYAIKPLIGKEVTDMTIDFSKVGADTLFDYELTIQSELPKNKQRLAQAANILLEKQAQYNPNPEIITMEEWLMMQDIPFKDLIYTRIGLQRGDNITEEVTQVLFQFAGLVEEGMDPQQALEMVVQSLQTQKDPQAQANLGNTASAASFQDRQAG